MLKNIWFKKNKECNYSFFFSQYLDFLDEPTPKYIYVYLKLNTTYKPYHYKIRTTYFDNGTKVHMLHAKKYINHTILKGSN